MECRPLDGETAGREDERLLLTRVQDGDAQACNALVRLHQARALAIAYRAVGTREEAEDVVQDAFVRAFRYIGGFDPRQPFAPWFGRLVLNTALDARARRAREATEPERPDAVSPCISPHLALERREVRDRFAASLAALPERQRLVLARIEVDGVSANEVALELGITPETVRWHLHQARRALRAPLGVLRDPESPSLLRVV